MNRVSLAIALAGAVAFMGCGGNIGSDGGKGKGVGEGTFTVTVQNGQGQPGDVLQIKGGYVTSTPTGIDCGGLAHTACTFDFQIGQAVTLTSHADAGQLVLTWAGDCTGIGSTCDLPAGNSPRYVLIQFGTQADRTVHPPWTAPRVHGHEVAARTFTCSACHGQAMQGEGIAPGCVGCHDSTFALTAKGINESPSKDVEECALCHASGTYAASSRHAMSGVVTTTVSPVTVSGADLQFTVNVKVDGVSSNAFGDNATKASWRGYRFQYNAVRVAPTVVAPFERFQLTLNGATGGQNFTVAAPVNGDYLVTIPGGVAAVGANAAKFLVTLTTSDDPMVSLVATAVANQGGANARDLVADQSCVSCHDLQVFREKEASGEWHHGANPYGVEACVVCHARYGSVSRSMGGDRLTAYVHGVHNSHEMPARNITANLGTPPTPYTVLKPAAVYARNDSLRLNTAVTPPAAEISSPFSIGFPGYMVNCSTCHDTQARLDAIMAKPITWSTCMSCHDGWDGFPNFDANVGAGLAGVHRAIAPPATTATAPTCATAGCHDGAVAFDTVGDVHLVRLTERNGLVYGGRDQSIAQGQRIAMTISSVGYDASTPPKLLVRWGATLDGAAINPCNTVVSTSAPIFHAGGAANAATGQAASNMSVLLGFAQGDDWVSPGVGTSPGQPAGATNLTTTNTTCSGSEATSTIPVPAGIPAFVTKAVAGLQGKPQITFNGTGVNPGQPNPDSRVIQVRSESPTYAFTLATGAAAAARRAIVSNEKCLACHPGSLYQHGGNRIDSVELCALCHDPAANERNNRTTGGVTAAEAYDGKVGETYDLRTMVHAIHSAGETGMPLVYYRTNGIYAFGSQAAIDNLKATRNWPGAGCFAIYGADASIGADCAVSGVTIPKSKQHNEIVVHYPRHLNDCSACHVGGSEYGFVDGTKAMAVTADPGASSPDQTDDVLQGSTTTACLTCHQSADPARQTELRSHAYDFGWTPSAFPNGRGWLIDQAATP